MATLKSQKMVRGRDLNSPLAVSTMDKAKGNGNGLGSKLAAGVSKNTKANYLIIDDTSCGIANMKERYDGVWSAAKSYDAEMF